MARPREFNKSAVLDKALDIFWRQGYARTSIPDLIEQTGVQRQSLYNAFGDKHKLYLAALDRYCERAGAAMMAPLAQEMSVKAGIAGVLQNVLDEAANDGCQRGCFVVNTVVERGPHDPDSATRVLTSLEAIAAALQVALERAQETGELSADREPRALAHFFTSTIQGLRVMTKAGSEMSVLHNTVEEALRLLK